MKQKKLLFIFGTRPEAIKLAPLIIEAKKQFINFETKICITAQHRKMLDQVLEFFELNVDYDLNLMTSNQDLFDITANSLINLKRTIFEFKPDYIIIQGDTTSAFTGALASFYYKIKIVHIEAGLRSFDKYSPYPEEMNRKLISILADLHFAPTNRNKLNLINENIKENIYVVGNTVIDAMLIGQNIINNKFEDELSRIYNYLDDSKKLILVTGHRRENFGESLKEICGAIKRIASEINDVEVLYPVHLNPNVQDAVYGILKGVSNIFLIEPVSYPKMLYLMKRSYIVLTDSGGIQEEAPSLGKPVLVTRDVTERYEGIEAGNAKLVGANSEKIFDQTEKLVNDPIEYSKMSNASNPYGDGKAASRILEVLKNQI